MSLKDKFVEFSYREQNTKNSSLKNETDLQYMDSVSSAVLLNTTLGTKLMLWIGFFLIIFLITWAYLSEIDALTRGQGKVIPSRQVQIIQNLEGGIVSEILVREGDTVKKGDVLVKIDDTNLASTFLENQLRFNELQAKSIRLLAESTGSNFLASDKIRKKSPNLIKHEESLYRSNKQQLQNNISIYNRRLNQKRAELREAQAKILQLRTNFELISKEASISKPLVKKGIMSEVEFLQLRRQKATIGGELSATELSIPRLISIIEEQKNNIQEVKYKFQNAAKEAYNETQAEMSRLKSSNIAREDRVKRTLVRSPVDGTIKQLLVNTIGGIVKPGMDIIEVVPSNDKLIVEAKIKPADIAFLHSGQKAIVKFSAYDFAIYGSLEGVLTNISADTIIDKIDKKNYYLVKIKTDKSYLGKGDKKLYVKVGMTASVDIVTGKKTVLNFILKPILRAKANVISER